MSTTRHSKKLSWLLRHGANEAGLAMDPSGWARVEDVLRLIRIDRATLDAVVRDNDKRRLQLEGERVRCTQGHSLEGTPVTQAALEASWQPYEGEGPLFHGTSLEAARGIAKHGIQPMRRTHVHLAEAPDSRVGKRANVHLLLVVDPSHLTGTWRSPNGVLLTRSVPVAAITGTRPISRRAKAASEDLERLFGPR